MQQFKIYMTDFFLFVLINFIYIDEKWLHQQLQVYFFRWKENYMWRGKIFILKIFDLFTLYFKQCIISETKYEDKHNNKVVSRAKQ